MSRSARRTRKLFRFRRTAVKKGRCGSRRPLFLKRQRRAYLPFLGVFSSFLAFFFIEDLLAVVVELASVVTGNPFASYTSAK